MREDESARTGSDGPGRMKRRGGQGSDKSKSDIMGDLGMGRKSNANFGKNKPY
jgi:hypothetical protein